MYLNRLALSTFTEVEAQFSNQDSRLRPVIEKAGKLSILQYPRSITVTSAILINKVQPCPTSSGNICTVLYDNISIIQQSNLCLWQVIFYMMQQFFLGFLYSTLNSTLICLFVCFCMVTLTYQELSFPCSVGIEHVKDLIQDLEQALDKI